MVISIHCTRLHLKDYKLIFRESMKSIKKKKKMLGMNVDNSSLPFIRTSQHRLFENMNRMFNSIKSPTIILTPECPHITLRDCLPYFATTIDYGNFLSNKKAFWDTIFGLTKSLQMMQISWARYPCH